VWNPLASLFKQSLPNQWQDPLRTRNAQPGAKNGGNDAARANAAAAALAGRLPPLLVAAERIAAAVEQGAHGRRQVGRGEAFWQFRLYSPGDEPRRLDWRQSAKSDRLYLRQMEWSAAQSVYLWCDLSASMHYKSAQNLPYKSERAQILLLALAHLLTRAGERVALLGAAAPPAAGRQTAARIAWLLAHLAKNMEPSMPPDTDIPAHAQVVLVGDFLGPLDLLAQQIARMTGRGIRGHLLQILDPAEIEMPFTGRFRFQGPEDEGEVLIPRVEAIRDQYRAALARHQAELAMLAHRFNFHKTLHRTDASAAQALLALYQSLSADTAPRLQRGGRR